MQPGQESAMLAAAPEEPSVCAQSLQIGLEPAAKALQALQVCLR